MCRLDISRRRTRVFLANSPTCFPSRDGSKMGHHGFIYFLEPIIVTHTHLKPLKSLLKIGDIYIYTQNSLSILLKSSYILHGPMDKICINHIYIHIHIHVFKILYMWVVAIVVATAFGGALSLSRDLWKSAYSRSNMKPKSIPKQARKWIEELFCWFQVFRQHFTFLSFCIHFLSFSFHSPFMFLSFVFMSLNFPSFSFQCAFMSFHLPSFACMFLSFCIHVLSFPF